MEETAMLTAIIVMCTILVLAVNSDGRRARRLVEVDDQDRPRSRFVSYY